MWAATTLTDVQGDHINSRVSNSHHLLKVLLFICMKPRESRAALTRPLTRIQKLQSQENFHRHFTGGDGGSSRTALYNNRDEPDLCHLFEEQMFPLYKQTNENRLCARTHKTKKIQNNQGLQNEPGEKFSVDYPGETAVCVLVPLAPLWMCSLRLCPSTF